MDKGVLIGLSDSTPFGGSLGGQGWGKPSQSEAATINELSMQFWPYKRLFLC